MAEHPADTPKKGCKCEACRARRAAYMREWARKRKESAPEAYAASVRAIRLRNRDKLHQQHREWYAANRDDQAARRKVYREVNSERVAEQKAAYYRRNREARAEYGRRYRAENREKVLAQQRAWSNTPKGKRLSSVTAARRRQVPYTDEALAYLDMIRDDPCAYCGGKGGTVDHLVPVSAGGSGDWDNLAMACLSCNAAKNARPLLQFLLMQVTV